MPAVVVLLGVLMSTMASCAGTKTGRPAAASTVPVSSASTSTSGAVTTVTTAASPTTALAVPGATFTTPDAAAKAIFKVWTSGDRAAAGILALAPVAELDKLFAHKALPAAKLRTCDDGSFGPATCFIGNGQGGVSISLTKSGTAWGVITIDSY